jgi:hypothetical protein
MAKLTSKKRNSLPKSEFAGPDRSFPIPDASHARNALARVANKPEAEKEKVRAAVHRKFPGIGEGRDKSVKKTKRRSRSRV